MGITNFHKMIKQKYPSSFKKRWLRSYQHVYVDINYALHYCSYGSKSEEDVLTRLHNFFDNVLGELIPTKTLNVCTDGVAPLAKLILQRKRRLGTSRSLDSEEEFSSLIFTPGTSFMTKLENVLKKYFDYVEKMYNIKVNYLDHKIDEAELKLKHKVMKNNDSFPNETHIVVTNDADMIVMLSTLDKKSLHNIFVFNRSNHENDVISIGKLLELHIREVGTTLNYNLDFALISLLMGNDYIPKVGLADFEKLWSSYKSLSFTNPNGLVNDNLEIDYTFFSRLMYGIITLSKNQFTGKLTRFNTISKLYNNYFDGLTWCLDTYYTGKCTRYDYMYSFTEGPHPLGLMLNIEFNKNILKHNKSLCDPINPNLYAILVLPNFGKNLIDKKYHEFMEKSDVLYSEEKCKQCKDFHSKMKSLNCELSECTENCNDVDINDENDTKLKTKKLNSVKSQISSTSKNMLTHKKSHQLLSLKDIKTISSNFEIYCDKINKK